MDHMDLANFSPAIFGSEDVGDPGQDHAQELLALVEQQNVESEGRPGSEWTLA